MNTHWTNPTCVVSPKAAKASLATRQCNTVTSGFGQIFVILAKTISYLVTRLTLATLDNLAQIV
jgi:hypothetical protein